MLMLPYFATKFPSNCYWHIREQKQDWIWFIIQDCCVAAPIKKLSIDPSSLEKRRGYTPALSWQYFSHKFRATFCNFLSIEFVKFGLAYFTKVLIPKEDVFIPDIFIGHFGVKTCNDSNFHKALFQRVIRK